MVWSALCPALSAAGHQVVSLVRERDSRLVDEIPWNPSTGTLDAARLAGTEAIINLAGENLSAGRWTDARRERIMRSRVDATRTLVKAISRMTPKPAVLVNASAVGFYGDRGDEVLTESSSIGHGFLSEVCLAWETHAEGAARLGVRTVMLRFGVILSRHGGALAKMLPLFRLGLGGRMGSGQQWMSWISLDDVVEVVAHVLRDRRSNGPINVVAPAAVTNSDFAASLGRALRRPAFVPAPAWALRTVFGRAMADEALLSSGRAAPQRLSEMGFSFRHSTVEAALRAIL